MCQLIHLSTVAHSVQLLTFMQITGQLPLLARANGRLEATINSICLFALTRVRIMVENPVPLHSPDHSPSTVTNFPHLPPSLFPHVRRFTSLLTAQQQYLPETERLWLGETDADKADILAFTSLVLDTLLPTSRYELWAVEDNHSAVALPIFSTSRYPWPLDRWLSRQTAAHVRQNVAYSSNVYLAETAVRRSESLFQSFLFLPTHP